MYHRPCNNQPHLRLAQAHSLLKRFVTNPPNVSPHSHPTPTSIITASLFLSMPTPFAQVPAQDWNPSSHTPWLVASSSSPAAVQRSSMNLSDRVAGQQTANPQKPRTHSWETAGGWWFNSQKLNHHSGKHQQQEPSQRNRAQPPHTWISSQRQECWV